MEARQFSEKPQFAKEHLFSEARQFSGARFSFWNVAVFENAAICRRYVLITVAATGHRNFCSHAGFYFDALS